MTRDICNYSLHILCSFVLAMMYWWFVGNVAFAIIASMGVGVFKEVYDKYTPGRCEDSLDMVANMIGIVAFWIVTLCLS
jgi:VanZ family protein